MQATRSWTMEDPDGTGLTVGATERHTSASLPQAEQSVSLLFPVEVLSRDSHVKFCLPETVTERLGDRFPPLAVYRGSVLCWKCFVSSWTHVLNRRQQRCEKRAAGWRAQQGSRTLAGIWSPCRSLLNSDACRFLIQWVVPARS